MIAPGMLRCGPASAAAVEFRRDREQVTGAVEVDGREVRHAVALARAAPGAFQQHLAAFTRRALDTRGAGAVSTQWLMRSSGLVSAPRLRPQLDRASSCAAVLNSYGVSETRSNCCRNQGRSPTFSSPITITRSPLSIRSADRVERRLNESDLDGRYLVACC